MKIERLSENQIRCTLNRADLADRELLLNELAYGTDRAKALFRDMMQQASNELGFEADDIPLMIEAIPVSPDCLILIITKVEDPEELDTRFSKFSKPSYVSEDSLISENDSVDEMLDGVEDANILIDNNTDSADTDNLSFVPLSEALKNKSLEGQTNESKQPALNNNIYRIFTFNSLDTLSAIAPTVNSIYQGVNSLYKNPSTNLYYLILFKSKVDSSVFNKACNLLSEYGLRVKSTYALPSLFKEHYTVIIENKALEILSKL